MEQQHAHPYHPRDMVIPGYQPRVLPVEVILGVFFSTSAVLLLGCWLWTASIKRLTTRERLIMCWFFCTGLIHIIVEGTVVANKHFFKDTSGNIINEIWKEYSKADSRYVSRDDFIITMEGVTAYIEGPACLVIIWAMATRKPWRFTCIILTSLGQLYGTVLYFLTSWHGGWTTYCRPEFLYFWFYFVIVNTTWLVLPFLCVAYAASNINAAVTRVEASESIKDRLKAQ